jgi:hypothetical protein
MVAPAGYGKTTVLAQWAERNGQAFAWVSVDEAATLLDEASHCATARDRPRRVSQAGRPPPGLACRSVQRLFTRVG